MTDGTLDETDFEYAMSIAGRAMQSMARQHVAPTPDNFNVWFHYILGTSSDLNHAIDILIGNKRNFDAAINRELFATYLGSQGYDEHAVSTVSQQLHSLMESARQYLATAIADNRSQMRAISEVADRSAEEVDPRWLVAE